MEKEGGVLARDAGAGGSEAGEKADGSVVRAVLGAWGWAGSLRLLSRHGLFRATRHSRKSGSREVDIHWRHKFAANFPVAANTKISCTSTEVVS